MREHPQPPPICEGGKVGKVGRKLISLAWFAGKTARYLLSTNDVGAAQGTAECMSGSGGVPDLIEDVTGAPMELELLLKGGPPHDSTPPPCCLRPLTRALVNVEDWRLVFVEEGWDFVEEGWDFVDEDWDLVEVGWDLVDEGWDFLGWDLVEVGRDLVEEDFDLVEEDFGFVDDEAVVVEVDLDFVPLEADFVAADADLDAGFGFVFLILKICIIPMRWFCVYIYLK
jgi:hypothetical protein